MATYETFAAVYDAVMDDTLYAKWTDFSLRHFPKGKKKLLELACGTGIQSVRFAQAGYAVTGLDLSGDMLKLAKKRATSAHQSIQFIEGNMLDLSNVGKYDLITCYSDSICYMQDEVEVGDVFIEVYKALEENASLFLMFIRLIKQIKYFLVILIMKMQMTLLWCGILMKMMHLILLSMN